MRKNFFIMVGMACNLLVFNSAVDAVELKTQQLEKKNIFDRLQEVEHAHWREKEKAIKEIWPERTALSDAEKIKLVEIFEKESEFHEEYVNNLKNRGLSVNEAYDKFDAEYRREGYVEYFREFAKLISSLKNTRTIPSLLRGLHDFGGNIVPTHIIAIGEEAVEPLLDLTKSNDKVLKKSSFFVLSVWVNAPITAEDYSIDESMSLKDKKLLEKIKDSFIAALNDKESEVRRRAVFGLNAFPEDSVINALKVVVEKDPYYSKTSKKYVIREQAIKTIEKLKLIKDKNK